MKKNILIMGGVALMLTAATACGARGNKTTDSAAADDGTAMLATDSISIADSLTVDGSSATLSIAGLYPQGDGVTADSVKAWIAESMSNVAGYTGAKLFGLTPELRSNGEALLATTRDSLLAGARKDFTDFAKDGFNTVYEYDIHFGPTYQGGKLVTYFFTAYGYQGGAHGGTTALDATFDKTNGEILTYDKVFKADSHAKLLELIKNGLWKQYFEGEGDGTSLSDALLIEPDSLELPVSLPAFGPDGVTFTYQQYEIASYAAGMPSCVIPYNELKPLMNPAVVELLP